MDEPISPVLSEVSQILYFTYRWDIKNKINEQTKQSYRYREQTGCYQRGGGWGEERNR